MSNSEVARPRGRVATAAMTIGAFVGVLWIIEIIDRISGGQLEQFGVHPRQLDGLTGIIFMPLLHGDWSHLIANTAPVLVLGFIILLSGVKQWIQVTAIVWLVAGIGTWLIGSPGSHIGASGLVFGWITFLVLRGFFARNVLQIVLGVGVLLLYGGVLWGVFPGDFRVSWQGHLAGAVGGVIAAYVVGRRPRETQTTPAAPA